MDDARMLEQFKAALGVPSNGKGSLRKACLCGKLLEESNYTKRFHSGVVNFDECLCEACRKETAGFVRVVCLTCKTLMMMLSPQKATTGFEFKAGACVHSETCQTCRPGLMSFPILEHLRFCRALGKPTNVDADIVQEAEQKSLQAVSEADRLRGELKNTFPQNEATNP